STSPRRVGSGRIVGGVDHSPGVHQQRLQSRVLEIAVAVVAPLGPPAVDELEYPVAAVEADHAYGVAADVLDAGFRHRDHAAGGVHEPCMHHHAGDEAVSGQIGFHLHDAVQPGVALGPKGSGCLTLFGVGRNVDVLDRVG